MLGLARAKAGDLDGARSTVATAIELSQRAYPHVEKAAGPAIISAATLLEASGDSIGALIMYEDVIAALSGPAVRGRVPLRPAPGSYSRLRRQLGAKFGPSNHDGPRPN